MFSDPPGSFPNVINNQCLFLHFMMPPATKHSSHMLPGAVPPPKLLFPEDIVVQAPPLDRRMDVSELGYIHGGEQPKERTWGSGEVRELRRSA